MKKISAGFNSCLQPMAKVIVSCRGKDGADNALAVAYCCNCSYDPPMVMVGIVPDRYSHHMIKETGCFVVNLIDDSNKALFDYMGSHSGRDENKLKAVNAKTSEAEMVNALLLDECPVNIECEVEDSIMTGSHEMFIAKVVYVHADETRTNEDGTVNLALTP